jgi:mono/diheme cytochrome c family protein
MERKSRLLWIAALLAGAGLVGAVDAPALRAGDDFPPAAPGDPLPARLSETGLFGNASTRAIHPDALLFTPQYPLWSDGTAKRRWIRLPPNTSIDAHDADAWIFPPGTRLWKEFAYGRPIETRLIERLADGSWRFAVYVWNADGTDAMLAPEFGIAASPAPTAPGGSYPVLAQADCRACHGAAKVPVLGFGALQLSSDRDPLAVHPPSPAQIHVTLRDLVARGIVRDLPAPVRAHPPRIEAQTPVARAALGYLHGNCGHCHRSNGDDPLLPVKLLLAQPAQGTAEANVATLESLLDVRGRYRMSGANAIVVPGHPEQSTLALRMGTKKPDGAHATARHPSAGRGRPCPRRTLDS